MVLRPLPRPEWEKVESECTSRRFRSRSGRQDGCLNYVEQWGDHLAQCDFVKNDGAIGIIGITEREQSKVAQNLFFELAVKNVIFNELATGFVSN
jgi:hypothetical protein